VDRWTFEGSIAINGVASTGQVDVLRGAGDCWFTPHDSDTRRHLSLLCVDRRMLLGELPEASGDAHVIESDQHRRYVGYHEEVHGHPADNERVTRDVRRIRTAVQYTSTVLKLDIQADTQPGELSRDDGFRADTSPWTIGLSLAVPRSDVRAMFKLSDQDAAHVERRFEACA